jgi:uncharacterized protein
LRLAMNPISELSPLLRSLQPLLHDGAYVFCATENAVDLVALNPLATFRELEAMTVIVEESVAAAHGLTPHFRAAWITLTVHSDLSAVGMTAAVATALADEGISCNVIAAVHHDHLFVPVDRADDAMRVLRELSERERRVV